MWSWLFPAQPTEPAVSQRQKEFATSLGRHPKAARIFRVFPPSADIVQLTPAQSQHATAILSAVPELAALRFRLCPTKMRDEQFWHIYFVLLRYYLEESVSDPALSPDAVPADLTAKPKASVDVVSYLPRLVPGAQADFDALNSYLEGLRESQATSPQSTSAPSTPLAPAEPGSTAAPAAPAAPPSEQAAAAAGAAAALPTDSVPSPAAPAVTQTAAPPSAAPADTAPSPDPPPARGIRLTGVARSGPVRIVPAGQIGKVGGCCVSGRDVFVSDGMHTCISVFNDAGAVQRRIGTGVAAPGMCAVAGDNVYIVDSRSDGTVSLYPCRGGAWVRSFGQKGWFTGGLDCPFGVAVGAGGRAFVTEMSGLVSAFDEAGWFVAQGGGMGAKPGQLMLPRGVCVYEDMVYVAESSHKDEKGNNRVSVFRTADLSFVRTVDKLGAPAAVCAMGGLLFVACQRSGDIAVVDAAGDRVVARLGGFGMEAPAGLAIRDDGMLFVAALDHGTPVPWSLYAMQLS